MRVIGQSATLQEFGQGVGVGVGHPGQKERNERDLADGGPECREGSAAGGGSAIGWRPS